MARYCRLLALEVTHEFLAHGAVPGLRYVPAAASAALMAREGLLWHFLPDGVELWQEQRAAPASGEVWQLGLDVHAGDALLRFYTAWPQDYVALTPGTQAAVKVWRATAQQAPAADGGGPVLWIDIAVQLRAAPLPGDAGDTGDTGDAAVLPWRFALASRKIHWKYFFSGGLAARKLSIVDLDASDSEPGIGFAPSPWAATAGGTAYLSASPVPMQNIPQQRLQLREAGAAGKVLIRRLPNASVDKLGKERGPNGQSMIVAEIYVHQ
jgi:hypothetical protein